MVLYNKLYNIDKYGHKKIRKQLRPLFQSGKNLFSGYKKNEIIRVAQENLYMLKRLNEKTSFYNVDKWNKDYETSQYYKKNHCLYSPIDFSKTSKCEGNSIIKLTKKKFFNKTHYASTGKLEFVPPPIINNIPKSTRRRKKFEDFNYRDLNLDEKEKSDVRNNKDKPFKKKDEIGNEENKDVEENKNNEKKGEGNSEEKKEDENNEENKMEEGDRGIKEQKQNKRDEKEENEEKNENNKENI
jgi:hypothetical protein